MFMYVMTLVVHHQAYLHNSLVACLLHRWCYVCQKTYTCQLLNCDYIFFVDFAPNHNMYLLLLLYVFGMGYVDFIEGVWLWSKSVGISFISFFAENIAM